MFARRLARERNRQGLTQQELADRTDELGAPISRATIAKIEAAGQRAANVSLEDVLILSAALHTSPAVLFLPIGEEDDVAITPKVIVHPHLAMKWIEGDDPLMPRHIKQWRMSLKPLNMYKHLRLFKQQAKDARSELQRAERAGGEARQERAAKRYEEALIALDQHMHDMADHEVRPAELDENTMADMRAIGLEPWTEDQ